MGFFSFITLTWSFFYSICLPIFLLIGGGYLIDRVFLLDLRTLVKVNLYLFVPSFLFVALAESVLEGGIAFRIIAFTLAHLVGLYFVNLFFIKIFSIKTKKKHLLQLTTLTYNSANFGIPLIMLSYPKVGGQLQVYVILVTTIFTFTGGLLLACAGAEGKGKASLGWRRFLPVFQQPTLYAILLGLIFIKGFGFVPQKITFLWQPFKMLSQAVIPFGLVTLGVQLSKTSVFTFTPLIGLVASLRLVLSPLLAVLIAFWMGFRGEAFAVLVLAGAAPTAMIAAFFTHDFGGNTSFTSSAITYTTLGCLLTVPLTLLFLRLAGF